MFLKRLELQGFKSFADKTVLDFVNGATAVVGPNGSGKSNISDAIRWVIGEMSAKSLRGSNMQDVIFAGTETRKPLNFAEVSLVLDNSTHIFNIDFDEVIVTRRLFRSGESVYQINRANCRLKDIHELFMDTGLGRDGYSIIGQGSVAQILSTKAEDRRSLFEEAAGVSKYKYRKEEAERKLSHTEENLVRINDIVFELESQLAPLQRQSEKARKYLELYTEYRELDVSLSLVSLDKNEVNRTNAEELYKSVNDEIEGLKSKETDAERRSTMLYEKQKEKDEEKTQLHNKLIENENTASDIAKDISIAENNIKNNRATVVRVENEISALNEKNNSRELQIVEYNKEISEKTEQANAIMAGFDEKNAENKETIDNQTILFEEIEKLKSSAAQCASAAASSREKLNGIETLRQTYIQRRESLESEIHSYNEGIENTRKEIEEDTRLIEQKREKLVKLQKTVDTQKSDVQKANEKMYALNSEINRTQVNYDTKVSKRKMLEGMENDYAGYARSVKAVLKEESLKRYDIYGTVSGLLEVKRDYVVAIENALGGAMQNIIVESEEDAKAAIAFLRRTNAGRATFLPVSAVKGRMLDDVNRIRNSAGYIGIACELVNYDKHYDGIIKSLLGRVVVVDNIDNAIAMSKSFGYKFKVVTLEGDILNAGGSMSGGSVNKQSGLMSRAAEIRELTTEISELTNKLRSLKDKRETLTAQLDTINRQLATYEPIVREYEDEILRLENTCRHLSSTLENGGSTGENFKAELEKTQQLLKDTSDDTAKVLSEIRNFEAQERELLSVIEEKSAEYDTITAMREEQSKSIMDETMKLAALQKDVDVLNEHIKTATAEIEAAKAEIERKKSDNNDIIQKNTELESFIEEKKKMHEEISALSEQLKENIKSIDEQKANIVDSLKNIQDSNKDLTDTLMKLGQELSRVEARRTKLEMERESLMNHLWDEYELTYSTASEVRKDFDDEKAAFERSGELKKQIKSLGNVNMEAIEEYKEKKERFEFMSTQKGDLEKSKKNLEEIIDSMSELMEEHFENQFNIISESFSKVFVELFGGGRGKLSLSDPDNLLESGIEIEVQLPGKGLQNINLYSGGEKSFIAIALLFAILKVKPTPFCILDEIDAALDDVNVSRFATYLKNYTDQMQFIVITHRRGSMEAANILYGVTMQEKGVTKLLSLNIDDVDDEMAN